MPLKIALTVDEDGFQNEMQQQKDRTRAATAIDTEDWIEVNKADKTNFVGYHDLLVEYTGNKIPESKSKK